MHDACMGHEIMAGKSRVVGPTSGDPQNDTSDTVGPKLSGLATEYPVTMISMDQKMAKTRTLGSSLQLVSLVVGFQPFLCVY